ncbi:hypothetical protein AB1Y20_023246 [Prymnesium parvum]|uniref:Nuclear export mediator factor NEMF n=1 Tax=Prymnesium parvum TaxID=97485 RepID=A0AB34JE62_PRYPA
MVKLRFTTLDLRAMVTSLEASIIGYRITNIYDINPKTYILKLAKPDSKIFLLIESGIRIHTTAYSRDKELIPSSFTMKLRKHLRTRRIERIEMLGADRLVVLTCGTGAAEHKLILEMYDKGNIVLTDGEHTILTLLRNSKHDADARVTVHDKYPLAVKRTLPPPERAWLLAQLQAADEASTVRQVLMRALPLGKEVSEHCLLHAGVAAATKMSAAPWRDEALVGRLLDGIVHTTRYFHQAGAAPPAGIIVLKGEAAEGEGEGGGQGADARLYDEFAPFEMLQHQGRRLVRFGSFSEAVDEFFSQLEAQRAVAAHEAQQSAAWRKVDKIRSAQEGRLDGLRSKEQEGAAKARLVEAHVGELDALLSLLRGGVEGGMDWQELTRLVIESKKAGDPLASMVHALDLLHHAVDVVLTSVDDDADEEDITAPATLVRLDVRLTAFANARALYSEKKAAAAKTHKTQQAAEAAVRAAEKKAARSVQALQLTAAIKAIRQPLWFEKFDWFVSSENVLVVSARDGQQAELLVRRHLKPADLFLHADVDGAPVTVVKAARGDEEALPQRVVTLAQAGTAVICRSSGWASKVVTSAWWVREAQVGKRDDTGYYLPTGRFYVRGQRNYLPPNQLLMGLGVLFRVGNGSVAAHLADRRRGGGGGEAAAGEEAEEGDEGKEGGEDEEAEGDEGKEGGEDEEAEEDEGKEGGEDEDEDEVKERGEDEDEDEVKERGEGEEAEGDERKEAADGDAEEGEGEDGGEGEEAEDEAAGEEEASPPSHLEAEEEAAGSREGGEAAAARGSVLRMGADGSLRVAAPRRACADEKSALPAEGGEGERERSRRSAKERRQAKKGRAEAEGGGEEGGGEERGGAAVRPLAQSHLPARGREEASDVASTASSKTRGKHGKMKKLKSKYAEQDEEDRKLHLQLLGSAGQSKKQLEKERQRLEAEEKRRREKERDEKKAANVKKQQERENEQRERRQAQATAHAERKAREARGDHVELELEEEEEDEDDFEAFAELQALLEEESIQALPQAAREQLCAQDTLVSAPNEGDTLLHAVPVCAPYAVLAGYKYKVKLTPGAQKKGKAVKQAFSLFSACAAARERELIQEAMPPDEAIRVMLPNVKIASAGKAVAAAVRNEKAERKEIATLRKQGKRADAPVGRPASQQ